MRFFKALFTGRQLANVAEKITKLANPDEKLTQQEKDDRALAVRKCPDCGSTKLVIGPCGGAMMNVACADCRSEFNIMNLMGHLRLHERMGKLPEGREQFYGLSNNS